ncbi:MAG: hypothetical protein HUJ26_10265 [Planctomycetaceae bacterium]|nr:hypothetical protein [Planctomycetaceae bacterium]
MLQRQSVQLWQHLGTALLCGLAVFIPILLPSSQGPWLSVGCWMVGYLLLSLSGLSVASTTRLSTSLAAIATSLGYCLLTLPLLPAFGFLPAVTLTAILILVLSAVSAKQHFLRTQPARVSHVAVQVSSKAPVPEPLHSETQRNENQDIDAGLEQALLSRLSTTSEPEVVPDPTDDRNDHPQAIQFQSADREIAQRYERGSDPDGREWLEGTFRVDFQRHQKTAIVHIPFWPAFNDRPEVRSELLDGPHLKIDIKTVERWGIRLELTRRAAGLDPDSAELAFFVSTQSAARGAA